MFFAELTKIDGLSACFILDNENGNKLDLNKEFVEDFNSICGDSGTRSRAWKGTLTKQRFRRHSRLMEWLLYYRAVQTARMSLKRSRAMIFAPIEPDRVVKYITAAMSSEARMADIEKALGVPVDTFQTLSSGTVLCASGLSFPQTRLDLIYERIDENRETIQKEPESHS